MRLIDADQMALDESEAYMAAQVQIQDNVLRGINEIVHRKIQMLLADTPAVDAVPVVRCRECKFAYRIDGPKEEYDCRKVSAFTKFFKADHFCSYGEKRR